MFEKTLENFYIGATAIPVAVMLLEYLRHAANGSDYILSLFLIVVWVLISAVSIPLIFMRTISNWRQVFQEPLHSQQLRALVAFLFAGVVYALVFYL